MFGSPNYRPDSILLTILTVEQDLKEVTCVASGIVVLSYVIKISDAGNADVGFDATRLNENHDWWCCNFLRSLCQ